MQVDEAIKSISSHETLTGFAAELSLQNKQQNSFVKMIQEQEKDGNKDRMIEVYGATEIETLLNHKL